MLIYAKCHLNAVWLLPAILILGLLLIIEKYRTTLACIAKYFVFLKKFAALVKPEIAIDERNSSIIKTRSSKVVVSRFVVRVTYEKFAG